MILQTRNPMSSNLKIKLVIGISLISSVLTVILLSAKATVLQDKLTWAPPILENPTILYATETNNDFKLDSTKDYRIVLPNSVMNTGTGTANMSVNGGRNVVIIGGKLSAQGNTNGLIRFTGQTGILHIEGIDVVGPNLGEGFQFQRVTGIVQIQNVHFDTLNGNCGYATHHCDFIQTWGGGPSQMRIDRLSGGTTYQAFMLQDGANGQWDFRNIDIEHIGNAGWTIFDANPTSNQINMSNVKLYGSPNAVYTLGANGTKAGLSLDAPTESFVNPTNVGLDYVSPGYIDDSLPTTSPILTGSPSPAITPTPNEADLNVDGKINVFDLSILLSSWSQINNKADLNANGTVDVFDLSIVLSAWAP